MGLKKPFTWGTAFRFLGWPGAKPLPLGGLSVLIHSVGLLDRLTTPGKTQLVLSVAGVEPGLTAPPTPGPSPAEPAAV